jgi:hypothetical protein
VVARVVALLSRRRVQTTTEMRFPLCRQVEMQKASTSAQ